MVRAALLLTLATAASAAKLTAFKGKPKNQKNLLPVGLSNEALNLGLAGTCSSFEEVCDTDFCIPSIATCCSEGNGAYCELGKTCVENGCCPIGETCTGPPICEDDDEKICGTFCISTDADCCDSTEGTFCDSPGTCTSSGCSVGSLRGGSGGSGGGSSGGGGSGGGSSGGSEEQCFDFQEECGTGCMPKGSVCCSNGLEYCLSGQTCNNDGTCNRGGLGGGGSSDDDDDDDDDFAFTSSSSSSTTTTSTFGSSSLPTGLVSGGPDADDSSSDDDSSGSSDDDAPRSGDDGSSSDNNSNEPDAATVHGPSLLAVVVALVPLLL